MNRNFNRGIYTSTTLTELSREGGGVSPQEIAQKLQAGRVSEMRGEKANGFLPEKFLVS